MRWRDRKEEGREEGTETSEEVGEGERKSDG